MNFTGTGRHFEITQAIHDYVKKRWIELCGVLKKLSMY